MKPCPHCGGTGHVRSDSSVALMVVRAIEEFLLKDLRSHITVRTPAATALYVLNHKRGTLVELESRFGLTITIEADDRSVRSTMRSSAARWPKSRKALSRPGASGLCRAGRARGRDRRRGGRRRAPAQAEQPRQQPQQQQPRPASGEEGEGRDRKRRKRRRRRGGKDRDREHGAATDGASVSAPAGDFLNRRTRQTTAPKPTNCSARRRRNGRNGPGFGRGPGQEAAARQARRQAQPP